MSIVLYSPVKRERFYGLQMSIKLNTYKKAVSVKNRLQPVSRKIKRVYY